MTHVFTTVLLIWACTQCILSSAELQGEEKDIPTEQGPNRIGNLAAFKVFAMGYMQKWNLLSHNST